VNRPPKVNSCGAQADTISDLLVGLDKISVAASSFGGGLQAGALDTAQFAIGAATSAAAQFLYDGGTGRLSWDADGSGSAAASLIVTLTGLPALTAQDIMVV